MSCFTYELVQVKDILANCEALGKGNLNEMTGHGYSFSVAFFYSLLRPWEDAPL